MSKMDLSNTYMRVWIRTEDLLRIAFVVYLHPPDQETLIRFYLSLPIGYVDSTPYFCCLSETVVNLDNLSWSATANTAPHLLLALTYNPPDPDDYLHAGIISAKLYMSITVCLPPISTVILLCYINVYVEYFIVLMQGGTSDRSRGHNHIFQATEKVFRSNVPSESTC